MSKISQKENNTSTEKVNTTDSKLIGPRQEYRRTGVAPDDSDAMTHDKSGEGKPTTPYRY